MNVRERCALTTQTTAAAIASRTAGKRRSFVSADHSSAPGQMPVAMRADTAAMAVATATARITSSVMRGLRVNKGATVTIAVHTPSKPIRNPQTGAIQPGKSFTNVSSAISSGLGGCAATTPTSSSRQRPSSTMSVARRTRACPRGAA